MSTVVVTLATQQQAFPAGTVAAGIKIFLSDGSIPAQTITAAPYTASFADVPPGTYTATAQAVDASGNALGSPAVSESFAVAAPAMIDVPQTVTVQVQ